jgi:hypothetical protein
LIPRPSHLIKHSRNEELPERDKNCSCIGLIPILALELFQHIYNGQLQTQLLPEIEKDDYSSAETIWLPDRPRRLSAGH